MASERVSLSHRLAAFAIFAALLGAAGWSMLAPLAEAAAARDAVRARLARREAAIEAPGSGPSAVDPAEIAAVHYDDSEAQLTLQGLVDRQARAASLTVEAVRPAGAEALGDIGRAAWVEATLVGDLQAVVDFLASLDRERPLVLVRALELEAGAIDRPDAALRVRIEAGRAWRSGGAP